MAAPTQQDPSIPSDLRVLAEHYQILRKLGEGAFGDVYLARHDLLAQDFAIKVLKPELCEDESLRQRFLDEARALIRFSHPNVVQMRHVGEHDGRLYLVMDYVGGGPLAELIQKEAPLEEGRAIQLMVQILAGLEAAHAAGIVHRDLKPSNILVETRPDGQERLRILDFGLSKLQGVDSHRSVSGSVVGTLAYMSPEQLQGEKNLDGRSDVFAAGLILMEMLQGHHPYPGESGIVVAAKLLRDDVPPLDPKRASKVAPSTRSAIAQAVARDRDARFGSAVAFAQALMGKGPPSDTSKITTIQEAKRELARQDAQKAAVERSQKARSRRAMLVGALLVAALAGGAYLAFGRKEASPEPQNVAGGGTRPQETRAQGDGTPVGSTSPGERPSPSNAGASPETPSTRGAANGGGTGVSEGMEKPTAAATGGATSPAAPEPAGSAGSAGSTTSPGAAPAGPAASPEAATPPHPAAPPSNAPTIPEPATPQPTSAEPASQPTAEPASSAGAATTPEPTSAEKPAATPPTTSPTASPTAPAPTMTPREALDAATATEAKGEHAAARALYLRSLEADPFEERALRGVGDTWIAEADAAARRGALKDAIATLDAGLAWLRKRYTAYETMGPSADPESVRIASGVSRAYLAAAETERARWLALEGNATEAAAARKQASEHFRFAHQFLNRDSVRYWEMLIQRARLATLEGNLDGAVEDLAITTATNNTEVPAHMWVAHAAGLRRQAEVALAKNDRATAKKHALAALDVIKRGAAWQRAKFTREHYLEAARVLFVNGLVAETGERVTLQSLMRYYVTEAGNHPAPQAESAERSEARLAAIRGAQAIVDGLTFAEQGKAEEAKTAYQTAAREAQAAVAADERGATQGGPLPLGFPYRVLAFADHFAGDAAGTLAATQAGNAAASRNPE